MSSDVLDEPQKPKKRHDPEVMAIHNIMSNIDGRCFIWGQLQSCGVFETIFDIDPLKHSYNAGLREAGLRLKRVVEELEPGYYIKMIEENHHG